MLVGSQAEEGSACGKPGSFPVFHRRRSLLLSYEQGVDVADRPGSGELLRDGDHGCARRFLIESPVSWTLWALWTRRSRMASARVGSLM